MAKREYHNKMRERKKVMKTLHAIAQTAIPIAQIIIALPFIIVYGGYLLYMHVRCGKA